MKIYSLTLEERATCPRYCPQFNDCYANKAIQGKAWRYRHGPRLLAQLSAELRALSIEPATIDGFVVRIHVLGDFYDEEYVRWWKEQLTLYPNLRVWGYTAYWKDSEIGKAVAEVRLAYPDRFRVRWSNCRGELDSVLWLILLKTLQTGRA